MAKGKKGQIVTTDTQLVAMFNKVNEVADKAQSKRLDDIKGSIDVLGTKFQMLDEAVRGNGKAGLKADLVETKGVVAEVKKGLDDHLADSKEDTKENSMALRWKVGIVVMLFITTVAAVPAFHYMFQRQALEDEQKAKALIMSVIETMNKHAALPVTPPKAP